MNPEQKVLAESQAAVCSVFANPKRILILWTLADQEKSVSEIASIVGTSLQSTSQHLRLMRERGILNSRREGQTIYYFIAQNEAAERCRLLIQIQPAGFRERRSV
jgi:DNA-binding transcriptional ArsR family regulator